MNLHKGLNQLQILMKTFVVKKFYYPSSFIGTWFDQDNRQTRIRWMEVRITGTQQHKQKVSQ